MACDRSDSISRTVLYNEIKACRRTGYRSDGSGIHTGAEAVAINKNFFERMSDFAYLANLMTVFYRSEILTFVGHIGVYGHCDDAGNSAHKNGSAWDLTKLHLEDGTKIDSNWSWRSARAIKDRRLYVSMLAIARHEFGTVLGAAYPGHDDHIHMDNRDGYGPISDSSRADTITVQRACNELNGAGLSIDGIWGSATENAFLSLRRKLVGTDNNIRGNVADTRDFLITIALKGLKNEAA